MLYNKKYLVQSEHDDDSSLKRKSISSILRRGFFLSMRGNFLRLVIWERYRNYHENKEALSLFVNMTKRVKTTTLKLNT